MREKSGAPTVTSVLSVDVAQGKWLRIAGTLPIWATWPAEVIDSLTAEREEEIARMTPSMRSRTFHTPRTAIKQLSEADIRIERVQQVRRLKIEPGGKVASSETFVDVIGQTHEIVVPEGAVAHFGLGQSRKCALAYFIPNVIVLVRGGSPRLGELAVYPMAGGTFRAKATRYRSDGRYMISESGRHVTVRK